MQTIEVGSPIAQHQGCWARLPRRVALSEEVIEFRRIFHRKPEIRHPLRRHESELRVAFVAQAIDQRRQRIAEVLIFTASETITRHVNAAAKELRLFVKAANVLALRAIEKRSQS